MRACPRMIFENRAAYLFPLPLLRAYHRLNTRCLIFDVMFGNAVYFHEKYIT